MGDAAQATEAPSRRVRFRAWARRWWWVLIPIAAVATVKWWIKDPTLTLAYLKVLVWPAVVAVGLYWLRVPLRDKVGQLLKVSIGSAEAQFALNQDLQRDLGDAVVALQAEDTLEVSVEDEASVTDEASAEATPATDHADDDATDNVDDPATDEGIPTISEIAEAHRASRNEQIERRLREGTEKANREEARRRAIEKIIEESAEWGYGMAQIGFQGRPKPVIAWTDDGRPRILYGENQQPPTTPARRYDPVVKARNLEDEIRRLEMELATSDYLVGGIAGFGRNEREKAKRERLAVLKQRLRQVDPNSALAD
ncbi:MAG: hypothetical protein QOI54_150 [Actinomycetota bacterium]|jgi:hypothetical protein|nr:hypothetical protein [Actinomycetota bacterium]